MKRISCLVITLLLAFPVTSTADQFDPRLQKLFLQMNSTRDAAIAWQIESLIWQAWTSHDNPVFNGLMNQGIEQMNTNSLNAALNSFDQLIEMAPNYAEAWNKRATIYYILKEYEASEADILETLQLEPKHFGAFSGLGLVYMAQGEFYLARNAFKSALEINPYMQGAIKNLEALEDYFESQKAI